MTPKQKETLSLIAQGRVEVVNCGAAALRIHGASPQVVARLVRLGLARWPTGHATAAQVCELTDAGYDALNMEIPNTQYPLGYMQGRGAS